MQGEGRSAVGSGNKALPPLSSPNEWLQREEPSARSGTWPVSKDDTQKPARYPTLCGYGGVG